MKVLFDPTVSGGMPAGLWLRTACDRLMAAGIETAALDARMLLLDGLGIPHSVFIADPNLTLQEDEAARLEAMLARREGREPVSRILGWREFYGRQFEINEHVLDPRPDTETLVKTALDAAAQRFGAKEPCRLLDIGTGSGCIAISLLAERSNWSGTASDVSAEALKVAAMNADQNGVANQLTLVETNCAEGIDGKFDLVVSNPPYIADLETSELMPEVKNHDPAEALFAGPKGLDTYEAILASTGPLLSEKSLILFEAGATQADEIRELALGYGFGVPNGVEVNCYDLGGHERVVLLALRKN